MFSLSGAGGDHVAAVRRARRSVERRHHRLPVSDGQGALPGADAAAAQSLLREERQPRAQVRPRALIGGEGVEMLGRVATCCDVRCNVFPIRVNFSATFAQF